MISRSQRHLAIIDYPEGSLQQARWSISAFRERGFEPLLRRDRRFYRTARERPYLGSEVDPSQCSNGMPQWVWLVPAGALPTHGLTELDLARDIKGMTALTLDRGRLSPGLCFRHASGGADARARGWVAPGAGLDLEALRSSPTQPPASEGATLSGLIDPFCRTPWLATPGRRRWDPKPALWETGRDLLSRCRAGRWGAAALAGLRGIPRILTSRREDCAELAPIPASGEFSVTYLLERLVIAGGVLSVIQLVNELILLGVDARIACLFEDPAIYRWQPLLTRPMVFRDARELVERLPESDLAVATLWKTAPWVADLKRRRKAAQTAYFLQDYEPWFFPEERRDARQRVIATYPLIEHRIVKSSWLAGKLAEHGCPTMKIPLGLNLDVFHPGPRRADSATVMAMARPGTPQRGFARLTEALRLLGSRRPGVEVELFGSRRLRAGDLGFRYRNHGIVDDPEVLAGLYRRADVFVDTSEFQGFGRCALEAMACGTACVLTTAGAVREYAENEVNAVTVESGSAAEIAAQIERLLLDPGQRAALAKAGLETAARFDLALEAERTRDYFRSLLVTESRQ